MTLQGSGAYATSDRDARRPGVPVPTRTRRRRRRAGGKGSAGPGRPGAAARPDLRHGGCGGRLRAARQRQVHADPTGRRRAAGSTPRTPGTAGSGGCRARLPYAVYRPLVRIAHYAGLRRALRSGESVVVHDCGTQTWVRRWLAREARRRDRRLHLVLLDVTPETARAGQRERGRRVSGYAFARHRRAVRRLVAGAETGRLPPGAAARPSCWTVTRRARCTGSDSPFRE